MHGVARSSRPLRPELLPRFLLERGISAAKQVETGNQPNRLDTIDNSDLFPLVVCSSAIADRHLIDRAPDLGDLRRNFHFESEAARRNHNVSNYFSSESVISRFYVRHVKVCQQIRHK